MTRESTNETSRETAKGTAKEQQVIYYNTAAANNSEDVIDLRELFWVIVGRCKLIVALVLAGALIFGVYHEYLLKPTYQTDVTMFITTDTGVASASGLTVSKQLTDAYSEVIKSRTVMKQVVEELGLDMSADALSGLVDVTGDADSYIITIKVTYGDPELCRNIVNAVMDAGVKRIYQVIADSTPTVIDYSEAEDVKEVTPSMMRYLEIGGALGLVCALALILIRFLTDTTIKTEEDIQKYLDLPVLGTIPYFEEAKK